MRSNNKILLAAVIFFIAAFPSCREGIIDPENSVGNVNEPVVNKSAYSYTFQIDASNITFNKTDETFLDITETDIAISIKDYSGGSVYVRIIADNLSTLYDDLLAGDINEKPASVINHIVNKVELEFHEFSGKLKIQLTQTPRSF